MKNINNSIKLLFILGITCLNYSSLLATHVAGGTMTYRCLGNDRYEITMEFRRDCLNGDEAAPFDDPATFGVYDHNWQLITFSVEDNANPGVDFAGRFQIPLTTNDTLIETLTTECNVISGDVCIQTTVYRDTIRLPFYQGGYNIVYQRCCRNISLNNVMNPLNTGATYWLNITENALNACNSSPVWNDWPDIYICSADTMRYLHSAFDADGDSLVYTLCTPSAGLTSDPQNNQWSAPPGSMNIPQVVWNPGYNITNLFGGGDPLIINPNTGLMYAVPPPIESQFLVGVCVSEYRDGVLLSEIRRDFEYNIRTCGRAPVAVAVPDALLKCNSLEVEFTNASTSNFLPVADLDFTWIFDYPTGNLTSTDMSPTFTFPQSGLYTVALVADDGTCIDTSFVQVGVATEDDPAVSFNLEAVNCNPNTTIFLEALNNITTPLDSLDYEWVIVSGGQTQVVYGPMPNVNIGNGQDVEVTLGILGPSGCTSTYTETMVVSPVQNPVVNFGLNSFNCNSTTTIELESFITSPEAINENEIVWTIVANGQASAITGSNPTFDILNDQAISVTITVTTPNGCTSEVTGDFDVVTIADPVISFNHSATNCNSSTIVSLIGNATSSAQTIDPNSYTWLITTAGGQTFTGMGTIFNQDIVTDQDLTVQLQVSSLEGCTTTYSESISVITTTFNPQFSNTIVCPGESAVIYQNTNPANTVTINPQPANLTIDANGNYIVSNNQATASYSVTVANADCSRTETVNVTVDNNPSFEAIPDIVQCGSNTIQLNPNAVNGYVYQWTSPTGVTIDNSIGNPTASLPSSGTFFVTISTSPQSTCFAFDTVRVNRVELPTLTVSPNRELIYCEGEPLPITANSNGSVTWYDNNGNVVNTGNDFTIAGIQGSTSYTVESTTPEGCLISDQVEVQFIPSPRIEIDPSSQNQACFGEELIVNLNSDDIVRWASEDGTIIQNGSTLTIPSLDQDTTLIITVENDLGCTTSESISLEVLDLPDTGSLVNVRNVCRGVEFTLNSDLLQYDITVFDEDGNEVGTGHDISFPDGIEDSGTYLYEFVSADGCISFDSVRVNVFDEIGLDINAGANGQVYCKGFTAEIVASTEVDSNIEWYVDGQLVAVGDEINDYIPTGYETLIAVATSDAGCSQSDTIQLQESFASGLIAGNATGVICLGESLTLTYNPLEDTDYNIIWSPDSGISSEGTSITVAPEETTNYVVTYENNNGCLDTTTYFLTVGGFAAAPDISADPQEICLTQSTELFIDTDSDNTVIWSPATGLDDPTIIDPIATPEMTTTYTVDITDQYGCATSNSIEISVVQPTCDERDVFIPNMFTPNFDNLNDFFQVESIFLASMNLVVVDRWGEEVFSTEDQNEGWDGTYEGKILEPDVYGYYFTGVCVNGFTVQRQGNVTLIK